MKKISLFAAAAVAIIAAAPVHSFAWGKKGHEIVAEIAFAYLDSNTRANVQKCLGTTTIEQAATWMDDMKGDHSYDYMRTWHYVDFEKGTEYVPNKEGNIINTLDRSIDELKHRNTLSDLDAKKDLMMIFHLVGDLHQPLHTGYGTDKGGNDIQVKYLNHPSNLHRVWDSEIIESENITANDCLMRINTFDKDEIAKIKEINTITWIHEPRSVLSNVYNIKEDNVIDQAYVDKNKKIVEQQLLIAGLRLSSVLQELFKS